MIDGFTILLYARIYPFVFPVGRGLTCHLEYPQPVYANQMPSTPICTKNSSVSNTSISL